MLRWMQLNFEELDVSLLLGVSFNHKNSYTNCVLKIPELLLQITNYLPIRDIATLTRVCKRLYDILAVKLYHHVCIHGNDRFVPFLKAMYPRYETKRLPFIERIVQASLDAISNAYTTRRSLGCEDAECEKVKDLCKSMKPKQILGRRDSRILTGPREFQTQYVVQKKPSLGGWTFNHQKEKCTRSIVLTGLVLPLYDFVALFDHLPFLNTIKISHCNVNDDALLSLAKGTNSHLSQVILHSVPGVTDMGLHYLARYCKNLQLLDCSNCVNVSITGMGDVLNNTIVETVQMNKFNSRLVVSRKLIDQLVKYKYRLRKIGITGYSLPQNDREMACFVSEMVNVSHWQFCHRQIGSQQCDKVHAKVCQWFQSTVEHTRVNEQKITVTLQNRVKVDILLKQANY